MLLETALLVWRRLGGGASATLAIALVWTLTGTVVENLVFAASYLRVAAGTVPA